MERVNVFILIILALVALLHRAGLTPDSSSYNVGGAKVREDRLAKIKLEKDTTVLDLTNLPANLQRDLPKECPVHVFIPPDYNSGAESPLLIYFANKMERIKLDWLDELRRGGMMGVWMELPMGPPAKAELIEARDNYYCTVLTYDHLHEQGLISSGSPIVLLGFKGGSKAAAHTAVFAHDLVNGVILVDSAGDFLSQAYRQWYPLPKVLDLSVILVSPLRPASGQVRSEEIERGVSKTGFRKLKLYRYNSTVEREEHFASALRSILGR